MKLLSFLHVLPHFYYPVTGETDILHTRPERLQLDGRHLVIYRDPELVIHDDICPHQGASLAGGRIVVTPECRRLSCPYHDFLFDQGRFCGMGTAGVTHRPGRQVLDRHAAMSDGRLIYCTPLPCEISRVRGSIFQPPEAVHPDFHAIHGHRDLKVPQQIVTENVLDMMHISEVHTFGVPGTLAKSLSYQALGEYSGRSEFTYTPRVGTLATFLGGSGTDVCVQNEFHLPTTTVTRVTVGGAIKTVVTRAQPLTDDSTRLHWSIYYNFFIPSLLLRFMMERTLDEDVAILRTVTAVPEPKIRVPHDVTITKFREALHKAHQAV